MPTAIAADRPPLLRQTAGPVALSQRASTRVSAASTHAFRIAFGLLVALGSLRFLAKGWVDTLYLDVEHHLTYRGFWWVEPLPAPWMHLVVGSIAILGLAIAAGFHSRVAAGLFVIAFGYCELIEATLYLNHYWFMTLAGVLIAILPMHGPTARTVPLGVVWALRSQLAVVYLFAGVAKLNPDWLLRARPLALWLPDHGELPVVGALVSQSATAYVASWAGALFDLTIVFWLLQRRTRIGAYVCVLVFHSVTGLLFPIGVFPLVMIGLTPVFFEPDWPTRVAGRLGRRSPHAGLSEPANHATPTPSLAGWQRVSLGIMIALNVALPLRHYLYQGNVRWTEEGYYLAWRVMLTEKAGTMEFRVTDPATGQEWSVGPDRVLADWQITQAAIRSDLVKQTAVLIDELYPGDMEVRADAFVSMNGGQATRILDPEADLSN